MDREGDQALAGFGRSVAAAGDVNGDGFSDVVVGAPFYDNGQNSEGRAFVFHGSTGGLATTPNWTAESDAANADFGAAVATLGDVNGDGYSDVAVGARGFTNGHTGEGKVFVYHGSATGLATTPAWSRESDQDGAQFGWSVGTAGDVNGDGYADAIFGAPRYDLIQTDDGIALVYLGSASGLAAVWSWLAGGDKASAKLGYSVGVAGDVNGDGYADVIVGAEGYSNPEVGEGRAFVYHGSAGGPSSMPDWIAESNQANAYLGFSVATAGDVNGDGYSDVIVGAPYYDGGLADEGAAFVYYGSPGSLGSGKAWSAEGNQANAYFGYSVGTAGDVNGDGYADVVVGAYNYDNGQSDEGRAFVYLGSASGLSLNANWFAPGDQLSEYFGVSVGTAGDVNGDGYSDVIVGAWYFDERVLRDGRIDEGAAFVYHGSSGGLSTNANWFVEGDQSNAYFGYSAGTAGDVNGDGYSDVIVGAPGYDNVDSDKGKAFVYSGSASGLSLSSVWDAEGSYSLAFFGFSVGAAGDVNGDGYADVIVGAYGYDNGATDEGGAFVYHGNGGGKSLRPRQRRADDSAPVAQLGRSDWFSSLRLAALGRTPFGRGWVKLEREVKPLSTAFGRSGWRSSSSWSDTGVGGVELSDVQTGLSPNTAYHWRVRILYHPASSPFLQRSRWFTVPSNGWNEADLKTARRFDSFLPLVFQSYSGGW